MPLFRIRKAAPDSSLRTDLTAVWSPNGRALPRHVAVIMDGNGRWAARRMLPHEMGHREGVKSMREIIRESGRLRIEALTLYAFSTENWSRPNDEVGALMSLMLDCFRNEIDELNRSGVRVHVIGDVGGLPDAHRAEIAYATSRTSRNAGLKLNLALNYGGRDELVRAARTLARECVDGRLTPDAIDSAALANCLDTVGLPDVDLMIRTSGEMRLSNFLPFQSTYAELVVSDALWPDYSIDEYHKSLDEYFRRIRRFGGRK
ncbi:MAG: di-trans,poly-cis-decaprenylcistransferase [Oscillospiraceae bacterium]|jgi:undecaprenyl diphosphate synthase|nr:di-trans,poly-cis-decaprenylcistransferase [Oscillospiraceae bacterium]